MQQMIEWNGKKLMFNSDPFRSDSMGREDTYEVEAQDEDGNEYLIVWDIQDYIIDYEGALEVLEPGSYAYDLIMSDLPSEDGYCNWEEFRVEEL